MKELVEYIAKGLVDNPDEVVVDLHKGRVHAVVVEFGDSIDEQVNRRVYAFARAMEDAAVAGVVELVPTYRSLLVQYDLATTDFASIHDSLAGLLTHAETDSHPEGDAPPEMIFELPVAYGGEYGPDLDTVAEHAGLSPDEVIEVHQQDGSIAQYRVTDVRPFAATDDASVVDADRDGLRVAESVAR